jgi:MYXO-CTERM domain-containing protein
VDGTDGGSTPSGSQSAGCGCHVLAGDGQARLGLGMGIAGLLGVLLRRRRRR